MSDSDNYFSDSDKSIENEEVDPFENPQEDMDEETMRIIYESSRKKKDSSYQDDYKSILEDKKEKKVKKIKPSKPSKIMSLKDFNDSLTKNQPGKWKGTRFEESKKKMGRSSETSGYIREFQPKYPPPNQNTFRKKSKMHINVSEEDFPELEIDSEEKRNNDEINIEV